MSVSTPEERFGQAIHSPPAGWIARAERRQAPLELGAAGEEGDADVERGDGAALRSHPVGELAEDRREPVRRAANATGRRP